MVAILVLQGSCLSKPRVSVKTVPWITTTTTSTFTFTSTPTSRSTLTSASTVTAVATSSSASTWVPHNCNCGCAKEIFNKDVVQASELTVRPDGRCGPQFLNSLNRPGECKSPWACCSVGAWCGSTRLHCQAPGVNHRPGWRRSDNLPNITNASQLRAVPVKYVGCLECNVTLVIAGHLDDLSWLEPLLTDHRIAIYMLPAQDTHIPECIGSSYYANRSTLNFAMPNKGSEAGRYLAYLVQEYERLPSKVLFLHAEVDSWHDRCGGIRAGFSKLEMIQSWVWDRKCIRFLPTYCKSMLGEQSTVNWYNQNAGLFGELGKHIPQPRWTTPCCAQFSVHRDEIRQKSWQFYADLYEHTMSPENKYITGNDIPGHMFEMMWAKIFSSTCPGEDLCAEPLWMSKSLHKPPSCEPQR